MTQISALPGAGGVPPVDVPALGAMILKFQAALPGWWFKFGTCSVSRDASCGPDRHGPDAYLLDIKERTFDDGFHEDDREGGLAAALQTVLDLALAAKRSWLENAPRTDLAIAPEIWAAALARAQAQVAADQSVSVEAVLDELRLGTPG